MPIKKSQLSFTATRESAEKISVNSPALDMHGGWTVAQVLRISRKKGEPIRHGR